MMRIFRFRALWTLLAILFAYAVLVRLTPIRPRSDGLRAMFFVLSGWGMVAYWRPFRRTMATEGWPPGSLLFGTALFLFCVAVNVNTATGLFWRLSGQPAFLVNNAVFDVWIVLGIVALLIAVTTPDLFGRDVPPRDRIQLGTVWAVMFVLTAYLALARPNLDRLAETVRPWLDSGENHDPD